MSSDPSFTPPPDRWLAVASVAGFIICLGMAFFELSRAMEGNPRSWSYTLEWPLFGVFILWIWHRLEQQRKDLEDEDLGDHE
jgi:hypothetical protein